MSLSSDFKTFCAGISLSNSEDMRTTAGEIAKKLNKHYYDLDKDTSTHLYIVGSVGRNTAIKSCSDLDIIFDLPYEVYKKFDNYDSNGQSDLLQEIKNVLSERYPKTDMSGDGQVVSIEFTNYTVELVPAFKQSDSRFKYPDTHQGGSWKYTDPISEQDECRNAEDESNNKYFDFCHIIREWKNNLAFSFSGLLIDTLVYNSFTENEYFKGYDDYYEIFKAVLKYLQSRDENQSYWLALGSNQQVQNSNDGKFVKKANQSYSKIIQAEKNEDDLNNVLREILGNEFPGSSLATNSYSSYSFRNTEQFIQNILPVDIRYDIKLECRVTQAGWRDKLLSVILRNNELLRINKSLDFYIESTNCPKPYDIYWKVRNVGYVAEERNCIRGQIHRTNNEHQKENTNFQGKHFVECYLVKNGVCVAKGHIDVPIGTI